MTVAGIALDPKMVWLFGGVTALLVLASLIGFALSRAVTSETGQATVRNLNARIKAWWGMVAVFAVAFTFGKIVTILLFALVARRYEQGSIIVTSNRGFEAWGEILGDAMVAAALIDRLVHHAHIITLKGKSYRLRERAATPRAAAEIQPAGLRPTT